MIAPTLPDRFEWLAAATDRSTQQADDRLRDVLSQIEDTGGSAPSGEVGADPLLAFDDASADGLPGPSGLTDRERYADVVAGLIHTCYRVLDPEASVAFYEKLGFEVVSRLPIGDEATNIFMGLPGDGARLELTHNHDVEEPYEIGTGYGHIAITADDLDATLSQLAELGIEPEKPPYTVRESGSRLCFVRDPDGYRVELIEADPS